MPSQRVTALQALGDWARPTSPAEARVLPVSGPLGSLLPGGGLARGSTTQVGGAAVTSLALALVAGASGAGSWVAAVGLDNLGVLAAAELGIDLERLILVAAPPVEQWSTVVATLAEAFDVVLAHPEHRVRPGDARRLQARARERGSALVLRASGRHGAWPEATDLTLFGTDPVWRGLGQGHGHLQARTVTVEVEGRRAATRTSRIHLWLPGPDGQVALASPVESRDARRSREVSGGLTAVPERAAG